MFQAHLFLYVFMFINFLFIFMRFYLGIFFDSICYWINQSRDFFFQRKIDHFTQILSAIKKLISSGDINDFTKTSESRSVFWNCPHAERSLRSLGFRWDIWGPFYLPSNRLYLCRDRNRRRTKLLRKQLRQVISS